MLAPFLFVVIHGLLGTCSFILKISFFVLVGLKKSLFEKECKCEKDFVFEKSKYLRTIYLLEKGINLYKYPLDNAIPLLMSR